MKETVFRSQLAQAFRAVGAHVTLIENMLSAGAPDMHVCARGIDLWLELKADNSFSRGQPMIRRSQFSWWTARTLAGGKMALVALDKDHNVLIYDTLPDRYRVIRSADCLAIENFPQKKIDAGWKYIHLIDALYERHTH